MSPGTLLWVGLGLGLLAVLGGPTASHAGGTLLAAHRGGGLLWPENSLLAFRNAIALGADFLEFDVHLSKDGETVVIHDPTLERTTTGAGAVKDLTLVELRALRLKGRDGKVTDEAIPTLDELVKLAAPTPVRLLLEIKVDVKRLRYPGVEEKVLAILDRYGVAARTMVMAFQEETVRRILELRPEAWAGRIYEKPMRSTVEQEILRLRDAGAHLIALHHELVTAEVVALTGKAGLLLGVWTVNDRQAMKRFIELGVGILITDRPDVAKELLGR